MRIATIVAVLVISALSLAYAGDSPDKSVSVPILVYHRFGPTVADSMTIRTAVFSEELAFLKEQGYTVIPLRELVAFLRGEGAPPPARSVVITADDGHKSVYTDMFPLVRKFRIPVTLFIYPSAISNASYALTWDQLREMQQTGLFDIQSHTYWHPNFRNEKKRLAPAEYEQFVKMQLSKSKAVLQARLQVQVNMLAWPFGIYDDDLIQDASQAGYIAAFTLVRKPASAKDNLLALPRYLVTDADTGRRFENMLTEGGRK